MAATQSQGPAWTATRPQTKDAKLGPLLRMHPLQASQLPAHPDLPSAGSARPALVSFLDEVLREAYSFATTVLINEFRVKGDSKKAPPATATVELRAREINVVLPGSGSLTENWFARISKHENAVKDGTASWQEFDAGLRQNHSQHESDYTPDVKDAHLVLDWRSELADCSGHFGGWQDVHAEIREMLHQLPTPLDKRCFSVLVVTAKKPSEFIVVQIPLDLRGVQKAKYIDVPGVTKGIYASVEHGSLIENDAKVEWRMATASDAKGRLPMWAQKMGVPGAIVKDVGLFVNWRQTQRRQGS